METWSCVCGTNNAATSQYHGRSVQFNFFCTILLVVTTKQSTSHNAMATRNETKKSAGEINRTKVERWRPSLAKYLLHSRCHHNASHFAELQDKWRKKYITKSKSKQCAAAATTARGRGSIFSLSNTNFNVSEPCFHYDLQTNSSFGSQRFQFSFAYRERKMQIGCPI